MLHQMTHSPGVTLRKMNQLLEIVILQTNLLETILRRRTPLVIATHRRILLVIATHQTGRHQQIHQVQNARKRVNGVHTAMAVKENVLRGQILNVSD